jgi:hypothetical protein
MPSLFGVAASATMSGIGVTEAEKARVLSPELMLAGAALMQPKFSMTSTGAIAAVGVIEKTKL